MPHGSAEIQDILASFLGFYLRQWCHQEVERISLPVLLSVVFPRLPPVVSLPLPQVLPLSFFYLSCDKCVYSGIRVWTVVFVPSVFSLTLIKTHKEWADNTNRFLFVQARDWVRGEGQENEGGRGVKRESSEWIVERGLGFYLWSLESTLQNHRGRHPGFAGVSE